METSNLKNMIVLKNLPSNIVDEAIVVLKPNKNAKKFQKIEKDRESKASKEKNEGQEKIKNKDYILQEAEMLINNYISKIENEDKNIKQTIGKHTKSKLSEKYEKLKKYSISITAICILQVLVIIF